MDEKILLERDMNVELRFVDKYRSLILAISFSVPVLWIFLYPVLFMGSGTRYFLDTFAFVFLFAAMALTLNLEVGYLGLPNFGKVAFVMIGAYSYAMSNVAGLNIFGIGEILTGLIVAMLVTGFSGVILSLPTLKLREDYFAIVTIVAGEILRLVANNEESLGGFSGFPVTNFVFEEFSPDVTMSGTNLFFLDFIVIIFFTILGVSLYVYNKNKFENNFDMIKARKMAIQKSMNIQVWVGLLLIYFNYKLVYQEFASISFDVFIIVQLILWYTLKFLINFSSDKSDYLVYGSVTLYIVFGVISISTGDILNPGDTSINNTNWYFMLLTGGVMYVVYYIMELIYHSPFGRALRAIREDDTSALSIGKSLFGLRLRGLILSNVLTGFVAAFYAMILSNISPQAFLPLLTFQLYIMVIVGGTGNNKGVIFGSILIQILIQGTRRLSDVKIYYPFFTNEDILGFGRLVNPFNLALIIVGVTLIVFLIYAPEGIFPEKRDNNEEYQDLLYLLDDGVVSGNKLSLKILSKLVNVDVGKIKMED